MEATHSSKLWQETDCFSVDRMLFVLHFKLQRKQWTPICQKKVTDGLEYLMLRLSFLHQRDFVWNRHDNNFSDYMHTQGNHWWTKRIKDVGSDGVNPEYNGEARQWQRGERVVQAEPQSRKCSRKTRIEWSWGWGRLGEDEIIYVECCQKEFG